jgi:hypothetical protein
MTTTPQTAVPFERLVDDLSQVSSRDMPAIRSAIWTLYTRFRQIVADDSSDIPATAWPDFPQLRQDDGDFEYAIFALKFSRWIRALPVQAVERILNTAVLP